MKCRAFQVYVVVGNFETLDVGWCVCVCVCVRVRVRACACVCVDAWLAFHSFVRLRFRMVKRVET